LRTCLADCSAPPRFGASRLAPACPRAIYLCWCFYFWLPIRVAELAAYWIGMMGCCLLSVDVD
jgi:hypothetical protein